MNCKEMKKLKDGTEHRQNEITQNYTGQRLFHSLFCLNCYNPHFAPQTAAGLFPPVGSAGRWGWKRLAASPGSSPARWRHLLKPDGSGEKVQIPPWITR